MTTNTRTAQEELKELAEKIRDYQMAKNLSTSELLRKFSGLGSDRTWNRILTGKLDSEESTESWLLDYRAVLNLIESVSESDDDDIWYDDMTPVARLRVAVIDAMKEKGLTRLIIVEGPPGSGKTVAGKMLLGRFASRITWCEANETWKDNPVAMLNGIMVALRVKTESSSAYGKLADLIDCLKETRTCICIDEAHHLGPRTLNLVKTIINLTKCEMVLIAMETLWRKLETKAYEEARQLTQNRLLERIRLSGLDIRDVEKMLARRLNMKGEDLTHATNIVFKAGHYKGNMAFVRLLCRKALKMADDEIPTLEIINKACLKIKEAR